MGAAERVAVELRRLGMEVGETEGGTEGSGLTAEWVVDAVARSPQRRDRIIRWLLGKAGLPADTSSDYTEACILLGLCNRDTARDLPPFAEHSGKRSATPDAQFSFLQDLSELVGFLCRERDGSEGQWKQNARLLHLVAEEGNFTKVFPETCQLFPADFPSNSPHSPREALKVLQRENAMLEKQLQNVEEQLARLHAKQQQQTKLLGKEALDTKLRQLDISLRTLSQVSDNFQFAYSDFQSSRPTRLPENTELTSSLEALCRAKGDVARRLDGFGRLPEVMDEATLHPTHARALADVLATCKTATATLLAAGANGTGMQSAAVPASVNSSRRSQDAFA